MLQVTEQVAPQITNSVCRQTVGTEGHEPLEQGTDSNGQCQYNDDFPQLWKVYLVYSNHAVHCLTNEDRHKQGKSCADQRKEQHSQQFLAARLGIR